MSDYNSSIFLPFDTKRQQAILGHCLKDDVFFMHCSTKVLPSWFSNPGHGRIFQMMLGWTERMHRKPNVEELLVSAEVATSKDPDDIKRTIASAVLAAGEIGVDVVRLELTDWYHARLYREGVQESEALYNQKKFKEAFNVMQKKMDLIRTTKFANDEELSFLDPGSYLAQSEFEYANGLTTGLGILDAALTPDGTQTPSLYRKDTTIILAPSNVGKCHTLNTPILMFDGTIKMVQDVVKGDLLMGPDEKPRTVLSTARGFGQLYDVVPKSGGETWGCNDAHILNLKCVENRAKDGDRKSANRKFFDSKTENISVSEYLKKNAEYKNHMRLWRAEFDFSEKALVVPPRILGMWLGDGGSHNAGLTSADDELAQVWISWCQSNGDNFNTYRRGKSKAKTYVASKNKKTAVASNSILRNLGVLDNKHIPREYLLSSRTQRLELLAGLIDTGGYANKVSRCYVLTTVSPSLAEGYAFLARSLGLKATCVKTTKKIKSTGFSGEYTDVIIRGKVSEIPVILEYKKLKDSKKDPTVSGFTVKEKGVGDYYGFTLDKDGLYVLGDFTVTHNTSFMITTMVHNMMRGKHILFLTHEGRPEDIREKILCCATRKTKAELLAAYRTPEGLKQIQTMTTHIQKFITYIPYNKAGMNVEEVSDVIRRRQEEKLAACGVGYDLLVDDYPAKLGTAKNDRGNLVRRNIDSVVYDFFVQLALEYGWHALLAIQTNRQGSRDNKSAERLLTMEDVAECWDAMTMATNVISLNRDASAAANHRLTSYICKSRSSEVGRAVVSKTDYSRCTTHGNSLGGTWYRGEQTLSDQLDHWMNIKQGQEITQADIRSRS